MKKCLLIAVVLALSYFVWGALFGPLKFNVVALNTSRTPLDNVMVEFDRFAFDFGILPANSGDATYGSHIGPWPSSLKVTWIVDGQPDFTFSRELPIEPSLRSRQDEELELVVDFKDAGVFAYPRVREDLDHGLSYRYKD